MRDTVWAGKPQKLVDENGVPKGMKEVLKKEDLVSMVLCAVVR